VLFISYRKLKNMIYYKCSSILIPIKQKICKMASKSVFFPKEIMDIIDKTSFNGRNCKGCGLVLTDAEKKVQNYCSSCVCINKCTLCGKGGDFAMVERGACWSCRHPKVKCTGCQYSFDAMALVGGEMLYMSYAKDAM
jgi:hypothetical protein